MLKVLKSDFRLIITLVLLAFLIRIILTTLGDTSFHYDMSRDAYVAFQIWHDGNLKLLGPPTSTPGLYHGVLYYYLLAVPYFITQGNPISAVWVISLINSLTVGVVYLLSKQIFNRIWWATLGSIFYIFSFEAIQYAGWISNPSPAIFTVGLFYLGLWNWFNSRPSGLFLSVLSTMISFQFQFFLIYQLGVLLFFWILFRPKVSYRSLIQSLIIVFLGFAPMLVAIIKFHSGGVVLSGFTQIVGTSDFYFRASFSEVFMNYLNHFTSIYINNFIPQNVLLGGLLGLACLLVSLKNRFLLFCLLSNILVFSFGGHSSIYANIGLVVPAILSVLLLVLRIMSINRLLGAILVLFIFISSSTTVIKTVPLGQVLLVIPYDMTLKNELALIDKSYELSNGRPFSVNSVTLPLWTNTTWNYLYHWYGLKKYGYLPTYIGHNQVGSPAGEFLSHSRNPEETSFLIIEPLDGIPGDLVAQEVSSENSRTILDQEYKFRSLRLQLRHPI